MILRFRGTDNLLVGVGLFGEAAVAWRPLGANEVEVDTLDGLDDEQLAELGRLVRDPIDPVAASPGAVDGATAVAGEAPPRVGPGSARAAWAAHAAALTAAGITVTVTDNMGRDDIVEAVEKAVEAATS